MSELPEITEVERLTLKPGDILFVHVDARLDAQTADRLRGRVQAVIGRPDVKIVVLDRGITVTAGAP